MTTTVFKASFESKAKAKKFRIIALIAWVLAMAGQAFAILKLIKNETLTWLLVAMGVILVLAISGNL